jgi:inosine/xanthosine triphosphatase
MKKPKKKIAVASKNPVKIKAVEDGFKLLFPEIEFEIEAVASPSGVPDQPIGDAECFEGAWNRVAHLSAHTEADYYIAIEGGIAERGNEYEVFAWVVAKSREGKIGKGKSSSFFLPEAVAIHLRAGKELAHASDLVFNESNSGHKQGTVGILTNNIIDRTKYYVDPVIMALVPFRNPHLY